MIQGASAKRNNHCGIPAANGTGNKHQDADGAAL